VRPLEHLTYSTGPRGSLRLRRALGSFLTEQFDARDSITADNLFITPGLASALDAVAWAICDEGDGILIPQPFYNGFSFDLLNRSNARIIGVPYKGIEGYQDLDDLFRPGVNRNALEAALQEAKDTGIRVRALLISKYDTRKWPPTQRLLTIWLAHTIHWGAAILQTPSASSPPSVADIDYISSPTRSTQTLSSRTRPSLGRQRLSRSSRLISGRSLTLYLCMCSMVPARTFAQTASVLGLSALEMKP
jgi:hypothetical protein